MEIQRFSKTEVRPEDDFPLKCKVKRVPDPGICYVMQIDFDRKKVSVLSKGNIRYTLTFDDVEFIPDIFIFSNYNL